MEFGQNGTQTWLNYQGAESNWRSGEDVVPQTHQERRVLRIKKENIHATQFRRHEVLGKEEDWEDSEALQIYG